MLIECRMANGSEAPINIDVKDIGKILNLLNFKLSSFRNILLLLSVAEPRHSTQTQENVGCAFWNFFYPLSPWMP